MSPRGEPASPPPLPGPCVPVPQVRTVVRSVDGSTTWEVETHAVPGLDLDGHGSPVVLVPPDEPDLHPQTMYWTLYLVRGGCGHDLGEVQGMEDPVAYPGRSHGLRTIGTMRPAWPPRARGGVALTRYRFDGERYRAMRPERR